MLCACTLLVGSTEAGAAANPTKAKAMAKRAVDTPLEVKIGQMLMVGFRGLELHADTPESRALRDAVTKAYIGSVVLFDRDMVTGDRQRNIASPDQVRALTRDLQALTTTPLFIAVDQEGGRVRRFKSKFGTGDTRSARWLGKKNDVALTAKYARQTARTLADLGVNMNFAPVVDLDLEPDSPAIGRHGRSYSSDARRVIRHAEAVIAAHRAEQVLTVIKHFPGHGSANSDSHIGVTDVTRSWRYDELGPYAHLIKNGGVDAIMTGHLFNNTIDPKYPATLSPAVISDLLRGEFEYSGVVISDDLQMKAIQSEFGFDEAIYRALLAGVDILMFANNAVYEPDIALRANTLIKRLVTEGRLDRAVIDVAYERITGLKRRLSHHQKMK